MLNARPVQRLTLSCARLLKATVFQNLDAENMEFVLEMRHDGTSEEVEDISLLCSTSGWKTGKQGVYYTAMNDQPEVAAPAEPAQRTATFGVRFSGRSSQGLADAVASSGRAAAARDVDARLAARRCSSAAGGDSGLSARRGGG
eukprot:tig00000507_g1769.t1